MKNTPGGVLIIVNCSSQVFISKSLIRIYTGNSGLILPKIIGIKNVGCECFRFRNLEMYLLIDTVVGDRSMYLFFTISNGGRVVAEIIFDESTINFSAKLPSFISI